MNSEGMVLNMKLALRAQMAEIEANAFRRRGIGSGELMNAAGAALALRAETRCTGNFAGKACAVICGRGNNGGDGYAAAARLSVRGIRTYLFEPLGLPKTTEAAEARRCALDAGAELTDGAGLRSILEGRAVGAAVDALFGVSFSGVMPSEAAETAELLLKSGVYVISADLPSGVESDTGRVGRVAVRASETVAFGYAKPCHFIYPAAEYRGALIIDKIGLAESDAAGVDMRIGSLTEAELADMLPVRRPDSHKGMYGRVVAVCGSRGMSGAAYMSAMGALRSGAGLVTAAVPECIHDVTAAKLTEATLVSLPSEEGHISPEAGIILKTLSYSSCAVGCGLGRADPSVLEIILSRGKPTVIDADGLNSLSMRLDILKHSDCPVVITPHPGEMSALTGKTIEEIQADRLGSATAFAEEYGCVTMLKGAGTVVASPGGLIYINPTGTPGMAKGGSGDVLAGMVAGLMAQGIEPFDAAVCAAYLHGEAGELCAKELSEYSMLASDLISALPRVFLRFNRDARNPPEGVRHGQRVTQGKQKHSFL